MVYKLLVFLFLVINGAGFAQAPASVPFDYDNYMSFVQRLDKFHRKLHGCDSRAIHYDECHPGLAELDLKLWKELAAESKKVFGK